MITKRLHILMLCSWLNLEKSLGSFFIEQAQLLAKDSDIALVHIEEKKTPLWKFYKYLRYPCYHKRSSPNGLPVYFMNFPSNKWLPQNINSKIQKFLISKFYKEISSKHGTFDLIHAQSLYNAGLYANSLNDWFGIPFIFTEHNQLSFIGISAEEIKQTKNLLKKNYPKLVVSHDKIRQFATNHLFADFTVIGNTIDETVFNIYQKNKKNEELVFTTIGACYPIKDQETIFKALEVVDKKSARKIKFNWIGFNGYGHNEEAQVENILKKYSFKNITIETFPFLNKNEVAQMLKESDLFLFSSLTEGMPVSVIEALACGVPVCTTNCGGVEELINDFNGKIIPIQEYEQMADFIINFAPDSYNSKKISDDLVSRYGSEIFRKKMLNLYLKTLCKN